MSATARKAKMAELHIENKQLRQERNSMIRVNAELIKKNDKYGKALMRVKEVLTSNLPVGMALDTIHCVLESEE